MWEGVGVELYRRMPCHWVLQVWIKENHGILAFFSFTLDGIHPFFRSLVRSEVVLDLRCDILSLRFVLSLLLYILT